MALICLVVCSDAKSVQVLGRVLQDLGITAENCGDLRAANSRIAEKHFDVLVIDCAEEQRAIDLIVSARAHGPSRDALIVAIVDVRNNVREVFAKGASFILYKPVSADRVTESFRAARGLMRGERRRKPRVKSSSKTSIAYATLENANANLVDLSEEGIGISSGGKLPSRTKIYFEFGLQGESSPVRLAGEVVWQDSSGRVGLRFSQVPQASKRTLDGWIKKSLAKSESTPSLPAVPEFVSRPANPNAVVDNRRIQSRHACRFSADVYRLGSTVPQRCMITDVSAGGCYVETTEPFPAGTDVEVVVRAPEMKLRLLGEVHANHPGFGMGIFFPLKNPREQELMKKLVAYTEQQVKLPVEDGA